MFLLDVKNSFRNMSRDVLYDSDRLTVGKFYLFGKVECRERFSKILSLNVFIAYII